MSTSPKFGRASLGSSSQGADAQPLTELFSQPNCQPCKAVERQLIKHNIPYIKHDVTTDENAYQRVIDMGYTSTPVTLAPDGTSFAGVHLGKIRALKGD